jgi:hypothetical protein
VILRCDPLDGVEEGHAPGNVKGKAQSLSIIDHQAARFLVQQTEQRAVWQPLANHHQPRGRVAAPDHRQHIRVREDSENFKPQLNTISSKIVGGGGLSP